MKRCFMLYVILFSTILLCSCGSANERQNQTSDDIVMEKETNFVENKSEKDMIKPNLENHADWVLEETEEEIEFLNSINRKDAITQVISDIGVSEFSFGDVDYAWDGDDFLSVFSCAIAGEHQLQIITSFDGKKWTVENITEGINDEQKVYYSTDKDDVIVDINTEEPVQNDVSNDDEVRSQYPSEFLDIYDSYVDIVSSNICEIVVNDLVAPAKEEDGYVSYNISFEKNGDDYFEERPDVDIGYYNGEISGFTLQFTIDEAPQIMKKLVIATVAVGEDIDYSKAKKKAEKLFDYNDSKGKIVLKLDKAKYVMDASFTNESFGGDVTDLSVTFLDKLSENKNKNEYEKLTSKMMKSSFNKGTKGYLKGKVVADDVGDSSMASDSLLISDGKNKYILFYDPDVFSGEFKVGKTYTFYGEVAKYRAGYSGYLRIDFFE